MVAHVAVLVGVGSAPLRGGLAKESDVEEVGLRLKADGVGLLYPFFDAEFVAVEPGLTFNYGEFAGIKIWNVDGIPNSRKLNGSAGAKPIGHNELPIVGFDRIGKGGATLIFPLADGDSRALYVDFSICCHWDSEDSEVGSRFTSQRPPLAGPMRRM